MKHKFLLALIATSIFVFACKDKEVDEDPEPNKPKPKLELHLGVFDNGTFSVKAFSTENVKYDSITGFERLGVQIAESNLPLDDDLEFGDLKFNFKVSTTLDVEDFVGGTNAGHSSTGLSSFGDIMYIDAEFYFPIKIGAPPVHGNDTIEIRTGSDMMSVEYSSQHSSLSDTTHYNLVP
ncbi:MAG: hypothetical protein JXR19_03630 [Bacteroidia bacterium]